MKNRYAWLITPLLLPAVGNAQMPDNPVACYSFTGNANDGSGNAHNGTVFGAVLTTDRAGSPNAAYAFNGVDSYIAVPAFETFGITDEVSVGMWVQADANTGNFAVSVWPDDFNDRFSAAPHYGHNGEGTIFWDFGNAPAGGRTAIIPYALSTEWMHFTFTSSATNNRMRIYVDGGLLVEETHHSTIVNAIGRTLNLGGGTTLGYSHWLGKLDDIVLYDRELSEAEVAALNHAGDGCAADVGLAENTAHGPSLFLDAPSRSLVIEAIESANLDVFDATGRAVAQARLGAGRTVWSTAILPPGTYVARLSTRGQVYSKRVLLP